MARNDPSKELRLLLAFFGEGALLDCEVVDAEQVPDPWHRLLVHDNHMTVTLEARWGQAVEVVPYEVRRSGDLYGRKLDLVAVRDRRIVMTGIMLIDLRVCTDAVREAILAESVPLGRILIDNGILRRITSETFLHLGASDPLVARFGLAEASGAWGRLATIFWGDKPAVDLLEIVRPE